MKGLLKADFRRVFKDKLLLVMGILAVAFAAVMPLLYAALFSGTGLDEGDLGAELIGGMVSGKTLFFSSFSLGNNLGLIAPVLLAIVLWKDFSFGTIRNKIIAGKSRVSIYFSLLITCATVLIAVILLHAFLTLGLSLIFFDYQPDPFTLQDLGYFLASLALDLLVLLFVAALICWLCASAKNVGLVIVLYVAISIALVMIGSILQVVLGIWDLVDGNEAWGRVLTFLYRINVGTAVSHIGAGSSYSGKDILYLTLSPAFGIAGLTGLGLLKFRKKDLK